MLGLGAEVLRRHRRLAGTAQQPHAAGPPAPQQDGPPTARREKCVLLTVARQGPSRLPAHPGQQNQRPLAALFQPGALDRRKAMNGIENPEAAMHPAAAYSPARWPRQATMWKSS
jgi:hypothetical protein